MSAASARADGDTEEGVNCVKKVLTKTYRAVKITVILFQYSLSIRSVCGSVITT